MPRFNPLPQEETLDVLITYRGKFGRTGRIWTYELFPPSDKNYSALYSGDEGLALFAGEHAQVSGSSITFHEAYGDRFVIDRVINTDFILKPGDRIRLKNPREGRKPNTMFSDTVIYTFNRRRISLRIATVLRGRVIDNYLEELLVIIDDIDIPTDKKDFYLIRARPA